MRNLSISGKVMWPELIHDLRYSARLLRKRRGFFATAVLTIALGVGATTAVFSLLDPLLLRKLPVDYPEELVWLDASGTMARAGVWKSAALEHFRSQRRIFSGVLAFAPLNTEEFVYDGRSQSAKGLLVSGDYFNVLGVRPYLGALLTPEDVRTDYGSNSVVLSYDYWQREFRGDESIVGKMVPIRDMTLIVAGVTPPEFFGAVVGEKPDFYVPLKLGRPLKGDGTAIPGEWVTLMGRLQPGVSITQAQAALEPVFQRLAHNGDIPEVERSQVMAKLLVEPTARGISSLRDTFSLPAQLLMAVAVLVLLIACFNVANLLIADTAARKQEIDIRVALGASRWQMVRQMLASSGLVTAAGTVAALVIAYWFSSALLLALNRQGHAVLVAGINARVLVFALVLAVLAVLLCGLAPAWAATRVSFSPRLKAHAGKSGFRDFMRLDNIFVLGQVALSVTALTAAGLLLHSLVNLETSDVGFDRDRVLTVSMSGNIYGNSPERVRDFYRQLLTKTRALPGVRSASLSSFPPISGRLFGINLKVEGYTAQPAEEMHAFFNSVTPGYFSSMGIPLLRGRDFSTHDAQGTPLVAVINRTMANHFFGNQNPLGRHFKLVEGNRGPVEIIGVVGDSRYNDLREQTPDFFYLASLQSRPRWSVNATLNVRTAADPRQTLALPLRDIVASLDNEVAITSTKTLRQRVDESLLQDRIITVLCSTFSALALALACIGLYGVLAFNVARRTGEIGIRMALGATRGNILQLVVGEGLRLVAAGLFLGIAGGLASAGLLHKLLFGVGSADPATLAGICALLALAALMACYLPARRAISVDPMNALRSE